MTDSWSNTILMLGCGGFIGSHLLERILASTEYHVLGVDIASGKIGHLLEHPRLSYHTLDIHDGGMLEAYLEKSSIVISLVALCNPALYTTRPLDVIDINFVKMRELAAACSKHHCRLIHFSTSEVYGRTLSSYLHSEDNDRNAPDNYLLREDTTPLILGPTRAQRWSYACAKQLAERVIYGYGFEYGLDYTIVRPFNFIGPQMDFIPGIDGEGIPRVLACFMDALLHKKPLQLVDGGGNRRCFTAIADAVDALMLILQNPVAARQQIFNIGNPQNEITIAHLAEKMICIYRKLLPAAVSFTYVVENVSSYTFYGEGYEDSDRRVPDCSKIERLLGWQPKISLDAALRLAIAGYITQYHTPYSA